MAKFKVIANGEKMGEFEAESAEGAIEAYAKDAGYESYAALCEVTGDDPEDDNVVAKEISDAA